MSDQPLITPTNIAEQLGITPITLRRWCQYHAAHLSPLANPKAGQAKRFTYRDLEVLKHVRSLRDQGMTTQIINDQLADLTFPEVDQNQEIDQAHDDQQTAPVTAVTQPPQSPLTTLDTYAINAVLARVDRLERSYKVGVFYGFGLGFIAACGVFLLILVVAVLYGGFR